MPETPEPKKTARWIAAERIADACARFPRLDAVAIDAASLDSRDARLASAIVRSTLERWLTIDTVLRYLVTRSWQRVDPVVKAILMTGAAQLLFLDRLPGHAVVDESVSLSRCLHRPKAATLINAVLRRLSVMIVERVEQPWQPSPERIPTETGFLVMRGPVMPPLDQRQKHLARATSMPERLVQRIETLHGVEAAEQFCHHGLRHPPLIVHAPDITDPTAFDGLIPHQMPGFHVWQGDHAGLLTFLAESHSRQVQDPTAYAPVAATTDLSPKLVIDYCAGRGTKTRQLAMMHPEAKVIATDRDEHRLDVLRESAGGFANVQVVTLDELSATVGDQKADLVLLDVPCSNTGVLSRRPEARYRYHPKSLASLDALQRTIVDDALAFLAPGGTLIYSTCSIDPQENEQQIASVAEATGLAVVQEKLTLPGGSGATHHDGGYFARLLRKAE